MGWVNWKNLPQQRSDPQTRGFAIVPSDTVPLAQPTRSIYVGGAGNLNVLLANDTAPITLTGVLPGWIYGLCISKVFATGTTATGLVGFY